MAHPKSSLDSWTGDYSVIQENTTGLENNTKNNVYSWHNNNTLFFLHK